MINFNPNREQKLLLQAALLPGETALESWKAWKKSVNLDDIDTDSYRLLPLLYRNLSTHSVTDADLGRLKGVYRRTWVENQVWFQHIRGILSAFQKAEIQTLLLKDVALNEYYYQDQGLRFINHLDILIHSIDVLKAIALLDNLGWNLQGKYPDPSLPFSHYIGFENKSQQYLSLRWHLFADGFNQAAEQEFWQNAILTEMGNFPVYLLCPTDQLFYTAVFGGLTPTISPIHRLADAAIILQNYSSEINEKQLIKLAENLNFILRLKELIIQLDRIFGYSWSAGFLSQINSSSISRFETQEYGIIGGNKNTLLTRFKRKYFQYLRLIDTKNFNLFNFLDYLQYSWDLDHGWQVPIEAMIRAIKRSMVR